MLQGPPSETPSLGQIQISGTDPGVFQLRYSNPNTDISGPLLGLGPQGDSFLFERSELASVSLEGGISCAMTSPACLASCVSSFDSEKAGDREVQRTMLELLNQLDGFQPNTQVKVSISPLCR